MRRVIRPLDPASNRLAQFAEELTRALGEATTVVSTASPGRGVTITLTAPGTLAVSWMDLGDKVILSSSSGLPSTVILEAVGKRGSLHPIPPPGAARLHSRTGITGGGGGQAAGRGDRRDRLPYPSVCGRTRRDG